LASLYDAGWRQGTIINCDLPHDAVGYEVGTHSRQQATHSRWVVVTQDCDLDRIMEDSEEHLVELRPILTADPPAELGIRSHRFKIHLDTSNPDYLEALSRRAMISAAALSAITVPTGDLSVLDEAQRTRLATWLGLRYDRPAVPRHLMELMKAVCETVRKKKRRATARIVRDVLVQVNDQTVPYQFSLTAVVERSADVAEVRRWLAEIALEVPSDLGVTGSIEAGTAREISLDLVETSYSADLSDLTWRSGTPESATTSGSDR
jgi:hypothetical protein